MGKKLNEVAQELKDNDKKIQLIYAFNGTGKTRLSTEFKEQISPKNTQEDGETKLEDKKIIYYNAFTEDLFYWDNDLENDLNRKLLIQPNCFTNWVFKEQGQENNVANKFKAYSSSSLTPILSEDFTAVSFSLLRGDNNRISNIKISKGEESNFVWCTFFALLEELMSTIEENKKQKLEETLKLEYVFIDDPVTSLDDSHLIQLAVDLAELIKKSVKYNVKFIITTHNAFFYNILLCEFNNSKGYNYNRDKDFKRFQFKKLEDGTYELISQGNESPFSYHLFLKNEIKKGIQRNTLKRYHFNLLRNMYEKSATFLGYKNFQDLLPKTDANKVDPYANRVINAYSHSKHSDDETISLDSGEKEAIERFYEHLITNHKFKE